MKKLLIAVILFELLLYVTGIQSNIDREYAEYNYRKSNGLRIEATTGYMFFMKIEEFKDVIGL